MRGWTMDGAEHLGGLAKPNPALGRVLERGFQGPKNEDWWYTNGRRLVKGELVRASSAGSTPSDLPEDDAFLCTVDGFVAATEGVEEGPAPSDEERWGFAALADGLAAGGAVVEGEGLVHVRHHRTVEGSVSAVRDLLFTEGELEVLERHTGQASGLTVANNAIEVGEGGELVHVRWVDQDAHQAAQLEVSVAAGGSYTLISVVSGTGICRVEANVKLTGEGANVTLLALACGDGSSHADHHFVVHHDVPNCTSRQVVKQTLDGRSVGVVTSRVVVAEGADGSDSEQTCKSLLLSEHAAAKNRPQLEIYTDEVVAAHGATVGQLDDEALHYMRTRGLDQEQATALLTAGFAGEIVDKIPNEELRALVSARLGL